MARIELAPAVADDFERIPVHLQSHEGKDPAARVAEIVQAISLLETSPRVGRPAGETLRELIIGSGSHGYVALYRYLPEIDTVFVLAIRRQREAGYERD